MAPEQGWGGEEREEREGEERRQWSTDGRSFWYEISHANKATDSRKSYCLEECLVHAFISLLAEEDVLVKKRKSSSLQACTYTVGHVVHQASLTRGSVAWSTYYGRFLLPPWNAWNGCKSSPRVPPAVMSQYPFIHMDEVRESGTKRLVYENIAMGRLSEWEALTMPPKMSTVH